MITRKNRFHGYGSLRYVYSRGQTTRGPLCAVKYIRNTKRNDYRLAVVVSKKVHKSAVVRNRIRRRLYETARLELAHITEPYDIVITVFSDQFTTLDSAAITKLVHAQFKQSSLI